MFSDAINGVVEAIRNEKNIKIHILVAVSVFAVCVFLDLSLIEFLFVSSAIFLVLISEMFNTSIERLCDAVDSSHNEEIKIIKDISAGATLLSVVYSLIVAFGIVFLKIYFWWAMHEF